MVLLVLVGLIVVIALFIIGKYNGLITLRNRFKNAWAQIDVQLKRRYDLIPNLVETAKAYMKHESQTLEAVIAEMLVARTSERQGRLIDHDQAGAMEKKKRPIKMLFSLGRFSFLHRRTN